MKICMDGKLYTCKDKPLIILLTRQDRKNIANMAEDASIYCEFEKPYTREQISDICDTVLELDKKFEEVNKDG